MMLLLPKTAAAICAIPVRCGSVAQLPANPIRSQVFSTTRVCDINASAVTPTNIVIARTPIHVIVLAALSALGFRNAAASRRQRRRKKKKNNKSAFVAFLLFLCFVFVLFLFFSARGVVPPSR